MTLEELTGLSGIETINQAYSAPIRRIRHTVNVGYWNKSGAYREEEFQVSGTLPTGITSLKIITDAGGFPVGKSLCSTLSLTFQNSLNLTENKLRRSIFKVQTSISVDGGQSYIDVPIGVFYPDTVKSSDNWKTITVEAFDEMHFLNERKLKKLASGGTLYEAVKGFWTNMSEKTYQLLNSIYITSEESKILTGFSAREAFGHIAVKEGGFFKIDRYGDLMIGKMVENKTVYNDDLRDKYDFKADEEEKTIAGVRIGTSENYDENIIDEEYGNTYLNISSSVCSSGAEQLTDGILGDALGFTDGTESFIDSGVFYTGKLSMRGNPLFEIGTVINFRERWGGNWHKRIIPTAITYDLTGGKMDITADEFNEDLTDGSSDAADQAYVNEKVDEAKEEIKSEINTGLNNGPYKTPYGNRYDLTGLHISHFGYDENVGSMGCSCLSHNSESGTSVLNTLFSSVLVSKKDTFDLAGYLAKNAGATRENAEITSADKENRLYILYLSSLSLIKNVHYSFIYDIGLRYHYTDSRNNDPYTGTAKIFYGTQNGIISNDDDGFGSGFYSTKNNKGKTALGNFIYSSANSLTFKSNLLGLSEASNGTTYEPTGLYLFLVLDDETTANVGYELYFNNTFAHEDAFNARGIGSKYADSTDYLATDRVLIDGALLYYEDDNGSPAYPTLYGSVVSSKSGGGRYVITTPDGLIFGDSVRNEELTLTIYEIKKLLELIQ